MRVHSIPLWGRVIKPSQQQQTSTTFPRDCEDGSAAIHIARRWHDTRAGSALHRRAALYHPGRCWHIRWVCVFRATLVSEIIKRFSLQKSPPHQSGAIHATTHRLFYIDVKDPEYASFSLDLVHVRRTEFYAGLFTSSPKVTLHLVGKAASGNNAASGALTVPAASASGGGEIWECEVCGCKNRIPAGHSPSSNQVCELCGVPRPSATTDISSSSAQLLSKSLPPTPKSPALIISDSLACPACTFLNHPSLRECEVCGTQLPASTSSSSQSVVKSAPATRPASPDIEDDDSGSGDCRKIMKLSFRKGGDKAFYTVLKRSLQSKAWEVRFLFVVVLCKIE